MKLAECNSKFGCTEEGYLITDEWKSRVNFTPPYVEPRLLEVLSGKVDDSKSDDPTAIIVNYVVDMIRTGVDLDNANLYECHINVMKEYYGEDWLEIIKREFDL